MSRGLILVGATIASFPGNGGIAWERLSWIQGFRRLGYDVFWIDELPREHCVDAAGTRGQGPAVSVNRPWFEEIVRRFDLQDAAALIEDEGESLYGPSLAELTALAREADVFVNHAGDVRNHALKEASRRAVYVDSDPGFTQLWLASGRPAPRIEGHDAHFTIGDNVGTAFSDLPTSGIEWRHTRQPVVLDDWPYAAEHADQRFTTVARWRGTGPHGPLHTIGQPFPQKGDELAAMLELPKRTGLAFEIALDTRGDDEPCALLAAHGWRVRDPATVAADPDAFHRYVRASWAEFSVAKGAYVATATGWFSERTTRYLASGRPALVQDTGFSRTLPVGEGLVAFRTLEEAVAGAAHIAADYERHRQAARKIAEEYFDSSLVLTRFLEDAAR